MAAPDGSRELGLTMCTALIVGNTIGIGIFMMPAALAPFGLNALTAWVITAVGCIFVAWVFAGLARAFPGRRLPHLGYPRTLETAKFPLHPLHANFIRRWPIFGYTNFRNFPRHSS